MREAAGVIMGFIAADDRVTGPQGGRGDRTSTRGREAVASSWVITADDRVREAEVSSWFDEEGRPERFDVRSACRR